MDNPSKLNPWYVTGMCEGEGTFTFSRSGRSLALYFAVKLTRTDRELLYQIQSFFGVGKIYNAKPIAPKEKSGYTKSAVYYRVTKSVELESIIKHFEAYPLRGEKLKRYVIWKELAALKRKNFRRPRWPNADWTRSQELLRRLSSLAPKNIPWDGKAILSGPTQ